LRFVPGYHSPLRARQAAQTRELILTAATRLFAERGWAATTLAAVAREAGTAVETVYAGFGSKSGLLTAAIDVALVGDDEPVPLARRPELLQLGVGADEERMTAAAHLIADIHARSVRLLRALREAAASDTGSAARWRRYEEDRRTEVARGLELVLGRHPSEHLVDAVWALAGPEVFVQLVIDRGWSAGDYEQWLAEAVTALARNMP
jgi:AcrR family transcriptional regulator